MSTNQQPDPDDKQSEGSDKPVTPKPVSTGRTFGGRGTEKHG